MFCYQCEQTSQGTGCTTMGICGKTPDTSTLQDVIVYIVKGISQFAHRARLLGQTDSFVDEVCLEALFLTLTNVNFDEKEHVDYITGRLSQAFDKALSLYLTACSKAGVEAEKLQGPAKWGQLKTEAELLQFGLAIAIVRRADSTPEDILSLQELLTYGVKGLAAYAHHAQLLGFRNPSIYAFVHESFSYLAESEQTAERLLQYCLEAGKVNYQVMELLDKAHTESYGHPVPTQVRITPVKGKAILISGHDMKSLYELLKVTEGTGVNVYTHGEMLPAHGYPALKKFAHLVGNYGGAWQNQLTEFNSFPGAIVMTTNCLKPPAESYKNRLFTMDVVGFEGLNKIQSYDYSKVIEAALAAPGFSEDEPAKTITVGFARNAVLSVAAPVIDAVKQGKIKHFFLIGGCDGAEFARNYFTDIATSIPQDSVILTLGCGKFRFNFNDFGDIDGIPRLLDLGQCNDAYSAVQIASALADAFGCSINELPLSLIISWFEQKAVAVLLSLLYLGVKNIRLGPNLPAFITPGVLKILVDNYNVMPVTTPKEDLAQILHAV